jgi:hypothetical protein
MNRKLEDLPAKVLSSLGESRVAPRLLGVVLIAAAAFGAGALLGRPRQERLGVSRLNPPGESAPTGVKLDDLRAAGL